MPCTVTAFSVKIAFPGPAAMELIIAREVMAGWNSRHALEQKRILLPLDVEQSSSCCDLLVAFFCAASSGPGEPIAGDAEAEVEQQLESGRPALVYFSDARVDLSGHPMPQGRVLDDFKKKYSSATIDSYADEKEFASKFAQQLEATINGHVHFKITPSLSTTPGVAIPEKAAAPDEPLSEFAQVILFEACDDFEGYIGYIKAGSMLRIQANGQQLVEPQDPTTVAKWDAAFHELLSGTYIRGAGLNGQLYQISPKGFEFLKSIGRNPVGYIAELGGM
jgi:hypothetical protein